MPTPRLDALRAGQRSDQYAYLSRGGTLWSWPGQNPFRWRDPSGRMIPQGAINDEGSRFFGAAAEWLAAEGRNEWGQGNYGTAALNFSAAFATGLASILASPVMDLATFGTVGGGIRAGANATVEGCGMAARAAPSLGGGATLEKLTAGEILRIQNAATRSGTEITVVGSRVNPNKALTAASDYDYVINANSATRRSVSRSLPGAKEIREGIPGNLDIFTGPVDPGLPHVTFYP